MLFAFFDAWSTTWPTLYASAASALMSPGAPPYLATNSLTNLSLP